MSVRRIVPNIRADDPAGAGAFFAEVLGLETVMDLGWIATFAQPGALPVQLSAIREDATAPVVADVSIEVDDVDAAYEVARARGDEIVHELADEAWGVRRFFVRAPGGAVINVLAHR